MLYSAKYNFIYSKTHKTASTSCEAALEYLIRGELAPHYTKSLLFDDGSRIGYRGNNPKKNDPNFGTSKFSHNHQSLQKTKRQITPNKFNLSYKISSIRNPYSHAISAFHYYHARDIVKELIKFKQCGHIDDIHRIFGRYLEGTEIHPHARNTESKHWYIGSNMLVDKFVRMEYLLEDLSDVLNHLNVSAGTSKKILSRIPEFKVTNRSNTCLNDADYYTDKTLEVINKRYSNWFTFGGYVKHSSVVSMEYFQ